MSRELVHLSATTLTAVHFRECAKAESEFYAFDHISSMGSVMV